MVMDIREAMTVTVAEGVSGDASVRRYTVSDTEARLSEMRAAFRWSGGGRGVPAGTYTCLFRGQQLWMSDTPAEKNDHAYAVHKAVCDGARRVLVNGLGLGMVVSAMLHVPTVTHIDVVEIDADVIALVGGHYEQLAAELGKTLAIHRADAFAITWPPGTAWDIAWHDIWPDLCTDYLDEMAVLHRRYGRRTGWQGSWGKELLVRQRQLERRRGF